MVDDGDDDVTVLSEHVLVLQPSMPLVPAMPVHHTEPFTDRKSTFQAGIASSQPTMTSPQAHVARVGSVADVRQLQAQLLQNSKIARATHNISAFRIHMPATGAFVQVWCWRRVVHHAAQDCDDDGEHGAASRMLHLLQVPCSVLHRRHDMQIADARDVCVVVSRWYGGVQLGPDRFRHINNAARCPRPHGMVARHTPQHRTRAVWVYCCRAEGPRKEIASDCV